MAKMRKATTKKRARVKYVPKRKFCSFCATKGKIIDYKDASQLWHHINDRGKIDPRRKTGTCAKHQHALAIAVKRARHLALLPYTATHIHDTGGIRATKSIPRP